MSSFCDKNCFKSIVKNELALKTQEIRYLCIHSSQISFLK